MATHTGLVIEADGAVREVEYTDKTSGDTIRQNVGGWFAMVPGLPNIDAYCDDEGLLKGLPLNARITRGIRNTYGGPIVGAVFFPKITDHKRAKLVKLGIL